MNTSELVTKTTSEQQLVEKAKLDDLAKSYMRQSLSPSTRKFYRIDFGIFTRWCEALGWIALPATPTAIKLRNPLLILY